MLRTDRLDLVAATPALAQADLDGREALAAALGVTVPPGWPPELFDEPALRYTLHRLEAGPEQAGWWLYYLVERGPAPSVVGVAGYKGPPDEEGAVEIGYAVLAEHRRRGLATEAAGALVRHAFGHPGVRLVRAETLPELVPSIGVLEKLGFALVGEGSEPGVIRYALDRSAPGPTFGAPADR